MVTAKILHRKIPELVVSLNMNKIIFYFVLNSFFVVLNVNQ